jgi:hypothetical protein
MERETRSRCVARHPRSNCNIYNTGNILNSIIPVLYQCIVTCMHEIKYAIVLRKILYPWYQQVNFTCVKQGCESLSGSPYPRVPQGGEGMITTQRQARSGSSIPWSRFVLLKTDTFGLTCMFSGHGLFLSENCAGCSNSPIGLIIIQ